MRTVYSIEEISLQGWTDDKGQDKAIRIYPLVLKKFRQLSEILEKFTNTENKEDEEELTFMDVLLKATAFAMETYEPALSDPDKLSEYLDWPTMERILEIAGGIKLNDPNLQAAMMAGKN